MHRSLLRLVEDFREAIYTLTGRRPDHHSTLRDLDRHIARGNLLLTYSARSGLADCGCTEHLAKALARETTGGPLVDPSHDCPRPDIRDLIHRGRANPDSLTDQDWDDLDWAAREIIALEEDAGFHTDPEAIRRLGGIDLDEPIRLGPLAAIPGLNPDLMDAREAN